MLKERYSLLTIIERRIFWVTLILAAILAIFASQAFDTFLDAPNLQYKLLHAIPFVLAIVAVVSALMILFGRKEAGAWVLLLGSFVGLLTTVSQAEDYSLAAAFAILAITLFVPLQLMKGNSARAVLAIAILATVSIFLVDVFWPLTRVPATAGNLILSRIASSVLGLSILAAIALQFRDRSIRSKLLILALGTGLISLLVIASLTSYFTQRALRESTRNSLVSAASHSMQQIDSFISYGTNQITSDSKLPSVIAYLKNSSSFEEPGQALNEMLTLFRALAQSDPENIASYALLDANGVDIVDTATNEIGSSKVRWDYFIVPMTQGTTYVSPARYSLATNDSEFYISAPVFDTDGTILGVLRIRYSSGVLQEILESNKGFAGEQSYGLLLDEYNIVLANGADPSWISRTLIQHDQDTYDLLQREGRIPNIASAHLSLDMPAFFNNLETPSGDASFFAGTDPAWGSAVEIGMAQSSIMPWKTAYVQPQSITFQVIAQQKQLAVLIALATGLLVAIAGFVVASTITRPILGLASTAEQIAAGDLAARASAPTNDEINTLATSFNLMTDRLKETLANLEKRVAERTADLEMARLLSERRAEDLQHISEISRLISSEQRLDTLLSLIARLVSEKFDFYHTGIFLIDDTHQFAVLQAANSEGGHKMLARGHRLEVGQTGLVGNVAHTGQPRIALDVGSDAVYFDNPDLPQTRSEIALPLNLRDATIGVLDVQSTRPGAFTENDAKTLSILADQIAVAIDNARLFGQNQQALAEVQALYGQYLRQEWRTFGRQGTQVGYYQSLLGGRPLHRHIHSEEIQMALQKGTVVVVEGKGDKTIPSIVVPVRLRGQTIGVLNIKAPTPHRRWSKDEVNLAQAVSDRLALALDNARLLFESQRQTAKEQKIGEVTAKIGASINMRNVLQTAVEELGRALPGSEVIIQFESNGKQEENA